MEYAAGSTSASSSSISDDTAHRPLPPTPPVPTCYRGLTKFLYFHLVGFLLLRISFVKHLFLTTNSRCLSLFDSFALSVLMNPTRFIPSAPNAPGMSIHKYNISCFSCNGENLITRKANKIWPNRRRWRSKWKQKWSRSRKCMIGWEFTD